MLEEVGKRKGYHPETLLVHAGYRPDIAAGAAASPIYQTASFAHDKAEDLACVFEGKAPGYIYSRITNPTVNFLENRIAALEGGIAALACSSGMSAISTLATTLAGAGDQIVSGSSLFAGTYSLFKKTLAHLGIETTFVDSTDPNAFAGAIGERCRMVFIETIGNPAMDVPDIAAIAAVTREAGVPLVVDSTVTTPYLVRPGELGADLVVHSTTKFISGHGTSIGGVIVDCGNFNWASSRYPHLREFVDKAGELALMTALRQQYWRDMGPCQSPLNAFLQAVGLESLGVRMEKHCTNAAALAAFLAEHPTVRRVNYPGLPDSPYHDTAERQFKGRYGAILTFELENQEQCFQVIDSLHLALNLANLGETRTLVIHPASTIYHDLSDEEKAAAGVTPGLIRVCVGIEHIDDIIADFDHALSMI